MNLSQLLAQRDALLRQAHLANLAYAYAQLVEFAARIARARLTGRVTLRHPSPEQEIYCATLTALEGNQSVLEEHFTDLDVMDLADVVAFACGQSRLDLTFSIQDFAREFLAPLRLELERLGLNVATWKPSDPRPSLDQSLPPNSAPIEETSQDDSVR